MAGENWIRFEGSYDGRYDPNYKGRYSARGFRLPLIKSGTRESWDIVRVDGEPVDGSHADGSFVVVARAYPQMGLAYEDLQTYKRHFRDCPGVGVCEDYGHPGGPKRSRAQAMPNQGQSRPSTAARSLDPASGHPALRADGAAAPQAGSLDPEVPLRSWIFQGKPEQYDLRSALAVLTEISWLVRKYRDDIHAGDRVYLWEAGGGGILAIAVVLTGPTELIEREDERVFWADPAEFDKTSGLRLRVRVRVERVLEQPVTRQEIKENPDLAGLLVMKMPTGTNFPVTPAEDAVLRDMIEASEKSDTATGGSASGIEWSDAELNVVVPAYFALLHDDIDGKPFANDRRCEAVSRAMGGSRSPGAVGLKFQSISAVMHLEELPYVYGLKPMWDYGDELEIAVLERLDGPADERTKLRDVLRPWDGALPRVDASTDLEVSPPMVAPRKGTSDSSREIARSLDAARLDATKRRLGRLGEEWAVRYERDRLERAGHPELAVKVERVSKTKGDGLGWDVESYTVAGEKRLLEVKTTSAGIKTPFVLTPNEREKWQQHVEEYELFRIFDFGPDPRFYRLTGMPGDVAQLTAASWEVRPNGEAKPQ